jgi:hypothetical protein
MDPYANVREQLALAERIVNTGVIEADAATRLAELVLALDEWRRAGGFDPYVIPRHMPRWRVQWALVPTAHNPPRVLFVEAASAKDASKLAVAHIERKHGHGWVDVTSVTACEPLPYGGVIGEEPQ